MTVHFSQALLFDRLLMSLSIEFYVSQLIAIEQPSRLYEISNFIMLVALGKLSSRVNQVDISYTIY